ncbi:MULTISPECIES: proteobacterial dedicated sortase system response regulator [unclassified Motilimonas]|uniref:proteobacterial dedicated sortase system response regulator n=1 Tax=unclassified Motilimonas TaxID=2643697 RepID=UPI001E3944DF|nr:MULTISPECIES: proteobacterial dedicated sortase system response regulator [unclassified Motilimonas]MCE0555361.1 proteobacterial dedicated sortase system response regulator [Motilimonas sp. E26]MDO6527135.1 proteobacterial dedicated sortase system response regulator [Motilimonas sp. 1_MG-2023]
MKRQIALVEDEAAIAANYKAAFERLGFNVNIYTTRAQALDEFASKGLPDLAIIDVGLADEYEGGFDLCRQLREQSATLPIIFLTARDSELDEVSGLRLGADDYLTKDISLPQMVARVKALLRRVDALNNQINSPSDSLTRGPMLIDNLTMTISWQGQPVELTLTEFWIVHALAKYPGQVKSRQQLMDAANVVQDDNTITTHIKRIRQKFKSLDQSFDHIRTAYGMGYRWSAE